MLKPFIKRFGVTERLKDFIEIKGSYFLVDKALQEVQQSIDQQAIHAGIYLGKKSKTGFIPSLYLLRWLQTRTQQKILLNDKSAWLFVCGRSIFRASVLSDISQLHPDDLVLVLNKEEECLGYGKVVDERVFVQNLFDLGDFLRREKKK